MFLVKNVQFSGRLFDKNKTMHNDKKIYQKLLFNMNFTTFLHRKSIIYKQTQTNKKQANISSTHENTIHAKYTSTHQDYNAK